MTTTNTTSRCRSCNAPIEWGESESGRRMPFDVATGESHFKTCPDAKTWSKPAPNGNGKADHTDRDHQIVRMSALRSAAIYCGHRATVDDSVKSEHEVKLAERWLQWIGKETTSPQLDQTSGAGCFWCGNTQPAPFAPNPWKERTMHTDCDIAAAELAAHFASNGYSHAGRVAELVLEQLPNGEHAWLRPSTDTAEDIDALYVPTESGRDLCRRWAAERACYSHEVS